MIEHCPREESKMGMVEGTGGETSYNFEAKDTTLRVEIICKCRAFWAYRMGSGETTKSKCPNCGRIYEATGRVNVLGAIREVED